MPTETLKGWVVVLLAATVVWLLIGKKVLSFEARERRRRRRSYGRVVTRRHGPAVRLAVKTRFL